MQYPTINGFLALQGLLLSNAVNTSRLKLTSASYSYGYIRHHTFLSPFPVLM